MAIQNRIDSNSTGLRITEEATDCIGELPGETKTAGVITDNSGTWRNYLVNSYSDLGFGIDTVSRRGLEPSRQRNKGRTINLTAGGGFNIDMTQNNLTHLMKGALVTDIEEPQVNAAAITDISSGVLTSASIEDDYEVGNLLLGSGSSVADQNQLFRVTATGTNTITVTPEPADDASPEATWQLQRVGHRFPAGTLDVVVSGTLPTLTDSGSTLTAMDPVAGDWIFVGGDNAALRFTNQATSGVDDNNGFMRLRSVAAGQWEVDLSEVTMTAEASVSETVEVYWGRVLHNQALPANQQRHTYQLERELGDAGSGTQAEYFVGEAVDTMTINFPLKEKITADFAFQGLNHATIAGGTTLRSAHTAASTVPLLGEDPLQTGSDIAYRLAVFTEGTEAPTPLFAYVDALTLNVANNISRVEVLGNDGAVDLSYGGFDVSVEGVALFEEIGALDSIRNNSDINLNWRVVHSNAGIHFDMPLMTMSSPGPDVTQDAPIKLPFTGEGATGSTISSSALDHTLKITVFPYLPTLAENS